MTPSRQVEFEAWAADFIGKMSAQKTVEAWGELIAVNGERLGHCEEHHPGAYADVKDMIAVQAKRIEKWLSASTSSAASTPQTPAPIPTTKT